MMINREDDQARKVRPHDIQLAVCTSRESIRLAD